MINNNFINKNLYSISYKSSIIENWGFRFRDLGLTILENRSIGTIFDSVLPRKSNGELEIDFAVSRLKYTVLDAYIEEDFGNRCWELEGGKIVISYFNII